MSKEINQKEFENMLSEGKRNFRNYTFKNLNFERDGFMQLTFFNCTFEDCKLERCSLYELIFTNCYFKSLFISNSALNKVSAIECAGIAGMIHNSDIIHFRVHKGMYIEFYIIKNTLSEVSIQGAKTAHSPKAPNPDVVLRTTNSVPVIVPKPAKYVEDIKLWEGQTVSIDLTAVENIKRLHNASNSDQEC